MQKGSALRRVERVNQLERQLDLCLLYFIPAQGAAGSSLEKAENVSKPTLTRVGVRAAGAKEGRRYNVYLVHGVVCHMSTRNVQAKNLLSRRSLSEGQKYLRRPSTSHSVDLPRATFHEPRCVYDPVGLRTKMNRMDVRSRGLLVG